MPSDKLTVKQENYVQGLFKGLSQRAAYKEAYNCKTASDDVIDVRACKLAGTDKIKLRLAELQQEAGERNMVTVQKVVDQLSKIAFADIKDILSFSTKEAVIGFTKDGQEIRGEKIVAEIKDSDEVDGTLIAEVSETRDGFKVKRNDQMKALELLGKHLGMFTDKLEMSGSINNPFDGLTTEELRKLIGK